MRRLTFFAVAVAGATLAFRPSPTVAFAKTVGHYVLPASTWDSVYTDSQTVRGDSLYKAVCIKCHGPDLMGTPDGNPLNGDDFKASWDGLGLDQIYDKILNEMPPDNPKTIPRNLVPDVMAFILKQNGFPAGPKVLPDSSALLKGIKFVKAKP
jgi:mono/diheme cytochrome c family protein